MTSVRLDEAPTLTEDSFKNWEVITTHPAFPFVPNAGTSPFIDIMGVLGDAAIPYFQSVAQFNAIATTDWPGLQRAFQFYFTEDWNRFDSAMSRLLEEAWPNEPNMLVRHDAIHRLLMVMILPLDPSGRYLEMQNEIWERAQPSEKLISYLRQDVVQSGLAKLHKRLFRQLVHLIDIRQMWLPALPQLWLSAFGRTTPDEWRLPGDDFPVLRGTYQQNYELSCQVLPLLVVAQNAADGRPATKIQVDSNELEVSSWIPHKLLGNARAPKTVTQFNKLNAEAKEAFLDRFPVVEENWFDVFDRGIRNAIAHADVDEIIATGEITTGKGSTLTYLRFVESVAKQAQFVLLWLNLVKLFRVYDLLAQQNEAN